MTVDIEAGGALATAGLVAKAIDAQPTIGTESRQGHAGTCANCKGQLLGPYCHACGQTAHVHRSLWHMLEEALHGVLHFDSKTWRTLPLLVGRPGLLTRRYIEGQRVRYVPPLALFLFTIFLMFFVLSFANSSPSTTVQSTPTERKVARAELVKELDQANAEVAKASQQLAAAKDDEERAEATEELEEAQADQRTARAVLSVFDKGPAAASNPAKPAITRAELQALTGMDSSGRKLEPPANLEQLAKNPELLLYKFKNTAYKFSFMLIPISLPFLWLMFFWKRDVTIYDHMVFTMYSLSFMSLMFVTMVLMGLIELTSRFTAYLLWLPPLHMFLQLKETYRLTFFSALWRTFALLASAGTAFILFMVMVVAITAI